MSERIVREDDDCIVYVTKGGSPEGEPGHWVATRVEWKPGHEPVDAEQ